MRIARSVVSLLPLGLVSLALAAPNGPKFSNPNRIRYDGHCFTIDGQDTFIFSGAFHYFRCPRDQWRERFQAIKNAGFNAVETYVAWNWSERNPPRDVNDFSQIDLKDLDAWLTMAEKEFGFYTIVRPGPYICAEWATGGFPNWLTRFKPANPKRSLWFRSDDPVFTAWSHHWFKAVAGVVAKHQLPRQPKGQKGVILWQVENEYDYSSVPVDAKRNYLRSLIDSSQKLGITVPIFTCWTYPIREAKGDPLLSQAFDNPNQYPRWNVESVGYELNRQHQAQPWAPKMVTEFQGGWFGQVGGPAAEEQDGIDAKQINALTLSALQNGAAGLNYYMLFGGTNFADWAAESITTSYDYFAPIREWGAGGAKYDVVREIGLMLRKYGKEFARADEITTSVTTTDANVKVAARRAVNGATYLFIRNTDRTKPVAGTLSNGMGYALPPFGMKVYRTAREGATPELIAGEPKATPTPLIAYPQFNLKTAEVVAMRPTGWKPTAVPATNSELSVWDSRFISYRATLSAPKPKAPTPVFWVKSAGGELISSPNAGKPEVRQGGLLYPVSSVPRLFTLLNPGWPNGGPGMEQNRGIADARVLAEKPAGREVTGWRTHVVPKGTIPADAIVMPVDKSWGTGATNDQFPQNTTVVLRTTIQLDAPIHPTTVWNTPGIDDEGWFYVNNQLVGHLGSYGVPGSFPVAAYLRPGKNELAVVIRNDAGQGGLTGPMSIEMPIPASAPFKLEWTDRYEPVGPVTTVNLNPDRNIPIYEHPKLSGGRKSSANPLVKSTLRFDLPAAKPGMAWTLMLKAGGDGFISLNGKALGRYWEVGPQRQYFLPPSFLKPHNVLELTVVPGRLGDRITAAQLRAVSTRW
jgi:hypothetical protein